MSNQTTALLAELKATCFQCIQRRLSLLEDSKRISRLVRDRSVLLFVHYQAVEEAAETLLYSPDYTTTLAEISAAMTQEDNDFATVETDLFTFMSSLSKRGESELLAGNLTTKPLNKRMIDALFLLKDKIRIARQRLNDAGEEYDQKAYVKARNRCSFNQSIYIGQLYRDLVFCTNEEIATLEQIHYPAIEQAEGGTFVASLDETADFLEALLLTALS